MALGSPVPIRPFAFTDNDYEAMAEVHNQVYPHEPITTKMIRHDDETLDATYNWARFVAEQEGRVVGIASYDPNLSSFHPRKFLLSLYVHPDFQGHGVGSVLYEALMDALGPLEPISVRNGCPVTEVMPRSIDFLHKRGFVEEQRTWDLWLDVPNFDPSPYLSLQGKLEQEGIKLVTLASLRSDPSHRQKFYELFSDVRLDVPRAEAPTPISFELFCNHYFDADTILYDGTFVAMEGERYVGLSVLFLNEASEDLFVGMTGVRRAYRRRGIALALKVQALLYAKAKGVPRLITDNESRNVPMLTLNKQLGFKKQPTSIGFVKHLREDT